MNEKKNVDWLERKNILFIINLFITINIIFLIIYNNNKKNKNVQKVDPYIWPISTCFFAILHEKKAVRDPSHLTAIPFHLLSFFLSLISFKKRR